MEINGEKLCDLILKRLYDLNERGVDSVTQADLLEDLRQSAGIQKTAFRTAIIILANENYIFDKASTCGLQPDGFKQAQKLF